MHGTMAFYRIAPFIDDDKEWLAGHATRTKRHSTNQKIPKTKNETKLNKAKQKNKTKQKPSYDHTWNSMYILKTWRIDYFHRSKPYQVFSIYQVVISAWKTINPNVTKITGVLFQKQFDLWYVLACARSISVRGTSASCPKGAERPRRRSLDWPCWCPSWAASSVASSSAQGKWRLLGPSR